MNLEVGPFRSRLSHAGDSFSMMDLLDGNAMIALRWNTSIRIKFEIKIPGGIGY